MDNAYIWCCYYDTTVLFMLGQCPYISPPCWPSFVCSEIRQHIEFAMPEVTVQFASHLVDQVHRNNKNGGRAGDVAIFTRKFFLPCGFPINYTQHLSPWWKRIDVL